MSTELRNLSSWELRNLAEGRGILAQCAARILAEREAAANRLTEICKAVKAENACRSN